MQGRGLKLYDLNYRWCKSMSPLMQGRGLKHPTSNHWIAGFRVAPYAGAWIETSPTPPQHVIFCVAPYAGAWIETSLV